MPLPNSALSRLKLMQSAPRLLFLLVLLPSLGWGELSKVYPTSSLVTVRDSAYTDGIKSAYISTDTFKLGEWEELGSSYTWVAPGSVGGYYSVLEGTKAVVVPTSWTLQEYTTLIYDEARLRALNEILDGSIEGFMVFPSTGPCPQGWRGWRQSVVNGKLVPAACQ